MIIMYLSSEINLHKHVCWVYSKYSKCDLFYPNAFLRAPAETVGLLVSGIPCAKRMLGEGWKGRPHALELGWSRIRHGSSCFSWQVHEPGLKRGKGDLETPGHQVPVLRELVEECIRRIRLENV